jgi:hypothetical protein
MDVDQPSANLEIVANDLDDATHKALDEEVLTEVGGNPSMATLLTLIVQNSNQQLDSKYGALKVAKTLIADNLELKDMLTKAWKAQSFKEIRNL